MNFPRFLASAVFTAAPFSAFAEDGPVLTGYVEAGREFEAERSDGLSTGVELDAAYFNIGFDGEAGRTVFGAAAGPRRLRGEVDFGPVVLGVDASGFRVSAYIGQEIAPGVLIGVYGAYQKETGDLESPFLTLGADLEAAEIAPFVAAYIPFGEALIEAGAALEIETGSLKVDLFPTERFTYLYGVAGVGVSHPIGHGFTARGGAEARYIIEDDPILGAAPRDRTSVRFYGSLSFDLDESAQLILEGDVRAFQARTSDYTLQLRVARRF